MDSKDFIVDSVHTDRFLLYTDYPVRMKENVVIIDEGQAHAIPNSLKNTEKVR